VNQADYVKSGKLIIDYILINLKRSMMDNSDDEDELDHMIAKPLGTSTKIFKSNLKILIYKKIK